ncbi:adenosylmethionine-8-amino-7-oxononanoate aminotransferase apoenzyme [Sulfuricurvum kujiense DSM 16994]|uniref:Adenosylmethionine-8-amino-7-oxononanoate aminotransferase n=1 Tax=Sulfuricurvum kujiense (strain ATCC BAA-921 / DSM 16994 / JCM 11577 / YK-1) TaxID=709032 RepID=E4U211_SULKY|nr:adenosylmethionine--8-amino-7-oxononanoate transaminase [Sulfuricurvum kujiense]ADR33529.1 adenosylmethionine-8-amino-7-oxononanoate aminotransferase apoenzyme [Sulfuricurvum kujiense DSM 16994]
MNNLEISARDLNVLWHPCTQMKDHETIPLVPIAKGDGVYLEDFEGNRIIDAISSWWVNLFGHCNPYINRKIKEQLESLEHVILAGFTHEGIVRLSERLVALSPEGLTRCFYADNGSSAIEVALKMSYHSHKNRGEERGLFVSLTDSYHGETLGALSVGDVALYKETYEPLLIRSIQTLSPRDQSIEAALEAAKSFEILLQERGKEIAALIVEPLVQGAGGMKMYHPAFLSETKRLCEEYGIHFIADEILVGFGRTGSMFACEQAQITPDFLVLSKGLTGGYLPLSVVLTTESVYGSFYCDYNPVRSFLHSHSYTGNALACAAANATLDIFESENVIENNRKTIAAMAEELKRFKSLPKVKEVRQCGMIAAIEVEEFEPHERIGLKIHRLCMEQGVLIRPLGSVIYVMTPYVITPDELKSVFDAIESALGNI